MLKNCLNWYFSKSTFLPDCELGMAQVAPLVANHELYPIALLIDELRNEDVQTRLNAVRQLEYIAIALGPSRTREELIPFLMESADSDDHVLSATAEKLGEMVDAVGGSEWAFFLLLPLEELLMLDEASVREKALKSILAVQARMPSRHIDEHSCALVSRLARNDWFVARMAACSLIPSVCQRAFSEEMLREFVELCGDETPMVRRSAIIAISEVSKVIPVNKLRDVLDAFRRLARDEQDSVRILTIPTAMTLARDVLKNPQESYNALFPEIRACLDDPSWRVRVTVAGAIEEIFLHTPEKVHQQVFDMYVKLLSDLEAEVRTVAVAKLALVCAVRPDRSLLNLIAPALTKLTRDDSDAVRAALAESLTKASPVCGGSLTADALLPFILKLLRDSVVSVRLRVVSNLEHITPLLKLDEMKPAVLPAIVELATDRQWRVRISVLEYAPGLAKSLGDIIFKDELLPVVMRWLCDPVFKVREAAASNLSKLAVQLGPDSTVSHIVPGIADLTRNNNYLYRMTALMAIGSIAQTVSERVIVEKLLPLVKALVCDVVPNVRFNSALSLQELLKKMTKRINIDEISRLLKQLAADPDKDVKFFALASSPSH